MNEDVCNASAWVSVSDEMGRSRTDRGRDAATRLWNPSISDLAWLWSGPEVKMLCGAGRVKQPKRGRPFPDPAIVNILRDVGEANRDFPERVKAIS